MRVWRVENKAGYGPYHSYSWDGPLRSLGTAHNNWAHPSPAAEGIDVMGYDKPDRLDWFCGMETKERLAKWFEGWVAALASEGFVLAEYDVEPEHVELGEVQLVFKKRAAWLLNRTSVMELETA